MKGSWLFPIRFTCPWINVNQLISVITIIVIQCSMFAFASTQWTPNMCVGKMNGILFPDPTECDSFFVCQRGAATLQKCQQGTSFDLNLYYCVPSHATNCGSRRQQSMPIIPPTSGDSPPSSESHHSVSKKS